LFDFELTARKSAVSFGKRANRERFVWRLYLVPCISYSLSR